MTNLLIYLWQVTFVFTVLYVLYSTVLQRLTFFSLNRCILLLLIPISLLLPLAEGLFPTISLPIAAIDPMLQNFTAQDTNPMNMVQKYRVEDGSISTGTILMSVYWIGLFISFFRFFSAKRRLILLKQKAMIMERKGYSLAIIDVAQPFSYFHWIFIAKEQLNKDNKIILEHEKAHIRLKHSLDLIFIELYIAFFWFNPLVYFYRKSLKSVHEFQADQLVLRTDIKTSDYMQLLLQSIELRYPKNLYSYFNHPIIKKRIDMMTKSKTRSIATLRYISLLIICALILAAFTKPTLKARMDTTSIQLLTMENLPPSLFPIQDGSIKDITSTYGTKQNHPKLKGEKIHGGIDIRATPGTPVIATADGTIIKAAMEGNWGNLIIISHADGYETWYAHLKGFAITKDQQVKKGDVIGYVGNTGLSTGPHLHYEVKLNGNRVNPMDYF